MCKRSAKFNQINGEAVPAMVMMDCLNIGRFKSLKNLKDNGKDECIFCGDKATEAEHMIPKSKGGNHTEYNVFPVCNKHKKPGKLAMKDYYNEDELQIISNYGFDYDKATNPHYKKALELGEKLRNDLKIFQNKWLEENLPNVEKYDI